MLDFESLENLNKLAEWLGGDLSQLEELTSLVEEHPQLGDLTRAIKTKCILDIEMQEIKCDIDYDTINWKLIALSMRKLSRLA